MSIFSFSFFRDSNINTENNKKINVLNKNNLLLKNETYPDFYKELKKELEFNPFFLTF